MSPKQAAILLVPVIAVVGLWAARGWLGRAPTDITVPLPDSFVVIKVVDGDTFDIESARIRLWGIDAPEAGQKCYGKTEFWMCGERATAFLTEKLLGKYVDCDFVGKDKNGREVGKCRLAGNDISEMMVRNGWAVDWPKYSGGVYSSVESAARKENLGIHRE